MTSIIVVGGPAATTKTQIGVITIKAVFYYEPVDAVSALVAIKGANPSKPMDNIAIYCKTYHDSIFFLEPTYRRSVAK